ncbi:uncharacterized protein LOC129752561 [Uranotaenia lowii]|uniref:uncharacterized protein LOC129752561 n=1 Tax=Uranotaenia lowii TaxID=190385 RepID=UPI002478A8A9|nr:uncharacterized protein LOC129752561 [Uranotaenia lowii]
MYVCEKCANEFEGDFWICQGFCSTKVCMRCSGMTQELLSGFKKNPHCLWMCYGCKKILSDARFSNALVSVKTANDDIMDSLKNALKNEIRESILQEIRSEIRTNLSPLKNLATPVNARSENRLTVPPVSAKRRRIEGFRSNTPDRRLTPRLCAVGTNLTDVDISANQNGPQNSSLFSLYLSGIGPRVPEERVMDMVRTHLGTSEIGLTKLVPKGRSLDSLSFVSFKVEAPLTLKNKALSTETWPVGVRFREFTVDRSTKPGFAWEPKPITPAMTANPITPFVTPVQS